MDIRVQHYIVGTGDAFPDFDGLYSMGNPAGWEPIGNGETRRRMTILWESGRRPDVTVIKTVVTLAGYTSEIVDLAVGDLLDANGTDGAHHKNYLIDQALRKLLGDRYADVREQWEASFSYDEGVAP